MQVVGAALDFEINGEYHSATAYHNYKMSLETSYDKTRGAFENLTHYTADRNRDLAIMESPYRVLEVTA